MTILLAIVPVDSFMGEEPHISFIVFLYGQDSTTAQAIVSI